MSTKKLSLFDVTIITVSLVIGMGIFRTPVNVAQNSYSPVLYYGIWIAGGLIALCGALTFAEIGSRLPVTGGYYKVFSYAYHPAVAFSVNCMILVSNAAGVAGVALVGAEYITGIMIPVFAQQGWIKDPAVLNIKSIEVIIAISSIIIFYTINLAGLKMSARTQNVLMVIKIVMIILLITPLFFAINATPAIHSFQTTSPLITEYIKAFGVGLVAVSFTFSGYQLSINFGQEVKEPRTTVPRGILMGMIIIVALYIGINYAYMRVIGFEELKTSKNIAAIMASKIFGINAERILSALLFLSVLAYVNVQLMCNPRVMAAMSEDKILPKTFGRRNAKSNVLTASLTAYAALSALIVFWAEQFDVILSFSIFLECFGMILSAAAIFILRKRTAHLDETGIYKMKLYPLLPILFIAAYIFIAAILMITDFKLAMIGVGVMLLFVVIYFMVNYLRKKQLTNNI